MNDNTGAKGGVKPRRWTFRRVVFASLMRVFGWMPLGMNHWLGRRIGGLLYRIPNRSRKVARRNIALCFPDLDEKEKDTLLRDCMQQMGCNLTELGIFWTRSTRHVMGLIRKISNESLFLDAVEQGNGVLLASPHLGAWELMSPYLSLNSSFSALYREPKDPGIDAYIQRGRARQGANLVQAGARGVRELYRALKRGDALVVLPDQQPKRGQGEFAPFFGLPALTMTLYSKMARKTSAPMIMAWMQRLPDAGGYHLRFEALPDLIGEDDLNASVTALNQAIETAVREFPAQYQWGYKRFSIQPDASQPYSDMT